MPDTNKTTVEQGTFGSSPNINCNVCFCYPMVTRTDVMDNSDNSVENTDISWKWKRNSSLHTEVNVTAMYNSILDSNFVIDTGYNNTSAFVEKPSAGQVQCLKNGAAIINGHLICIDIVASDGSIVDIQLPTGKPNNTGNKLYLNLVSKYNLTDGNKQSYVNLNTFTVQQIVNNTFSDTVSSTQSRISSTITGVILSTTHSWGARPGIDIESKTDNVYKVGDEFYVTYDERDYRGNSLLIGIWDSDNEIWVVPKVIQKPSENNANGPLYSYDRKTPLSAISNIIKFNADYIMANITKYSNNGDVVKAQKCYSSLTNILESIMYETIIDDGDYDNFGKDIVFINGTR